MRRSIIHLPLLTGAFMAALAAPTFAAPLPAPSLANDCGRTARVDLKAIPGTHVVPLVPLKSVRGNIMPGVPIRFTTEEEGGVRMKVVVDKDGKPVQVTVTDSSGTPALEVAVTKTVRERYRWEAPPPECASQGVVVYVDYIATVAPKELLIYADDPRYPAAAHERKMGAMGAVALLYRADISAAKALVGTGSDVLDAAMAKIATDVMRPIIQAHPATWDSNVIVHVTFAPDFIPSPRQGDPAPPPSQLPPLAVQLRRNPADVVPSLANHCGRTAITRLTPVQTNHRIPPYPPASVRRNERGETLVRVTVNAEGAPTDIVVVSSSGYAALDDVAVSTIKDDWRWMLPPQECAAEGVIIPVFVIWNNPPQTGESIMFLDDPNYPEQARQQRIGGRGEVFAIVSKNSPPVFSIATSTGSAELDDAMLKWAQRINLTPVPDAPSRYRVRFLIEFKPFETPYNIDVIMGPSAPRPDH